MISAVCGLLALLGMSVVAEAGSIITAEAIATQSLTITSVTGGGAGNVEFEVILFDDLFFESSGDGLTDASAAVTAGGTSLENLGDAAFITVGQSVDSVVTAIADRMTAGDSFAIADAFFDVLIRNNSLGLNNEAIVTMTYVTEVTASLTGAGPTAFGQAEALTTVVDVDEVDDNDIGFFQLEAFIDDNGIDQWNETRTIQFMLGAGEEVLFEFDGLSLSTASSTGVVPEPTSIAMWGGIGVFCVVGLRRRKR